MAGIAGRRGRGPVRGLSYLFLRSSYAGSTRRQIIHSLQIVQQTRAAGLPAHRLARPRAGGEHVHADEGAQPAEVPGASSGAMDFTGTPSPLPMACAMSRVRTP